MAQHEDSHSEDTEEPKDTRPYSLTETQFLILGSFPLSEGVAWATIFPYIYSMVKSLSGPDSSDDNIAVYVGIMVSVFAFGEFVGASQWAKDSDCIGRKPTILISSMGAVFSALLFGFSTSLPMAIAARACAGLSNLKSGVVPTFVGDLVRKDQQGMTSRQSADLLRRSNTIILPHSQKSLRRSSSSRPWEYHRTDNWGLPGRASQKNYPTLFHEGTIWDKFPYLLPNLVVVMFLLSSCTLRLIFSEEVHPELWDQVDIRWTLVGRIRNTIAGKGWKSDQSTYTHIGADEIEAGVPLSPASVATAPEGLGAKPPSAHIKLQMLSIAIQGFLKISTLAMLPVFLATPSNPNQPQDPRDFDVIKGMLGGKGGFGLDTISTSKVLVSQAAVCIVGQILLVPAIISRHGPLHSYRVAVFILLCIYYLLPFTANWTSWTGMPTMLIILWVYPLASSLATTCSAILITNTVPSPMYLAKVNGAAASLGCLARTLGPAVAGPLFRLGLQTGYVGLPFWLLGAVTGLGGIVSLYLTDHA